MGDVVHLRPTLPAPTEAEAWVATKTTAELKRLWDSDWLLDADPGCSVVEAIYFEMNKRGEGRHVAI